MDIFFIALIAACFAVGVLYIRGCCRMMENDHG